MSILLLKPYILAADSSEDTPTISQMCKAIYQAYNDDTDSLSDTRKGKSTAVTCMPWNVDQYVEQLIEAPTSIGCTAVTLLQLDQKSGLSLYENNESFSTNIKKITQEFIAKQNLEVSDT
jgi:hypothetical protein